ncbi:hypothetical protein KBG31_02700, partial [Patescibacteria group bacterium]|nr:hypothetical protein [Patescibacteria group bacterium]
YRVQVPEGGYVLVALGVGLFDGQPLSPVAADVGHIVVISGVVPDGATPLDLNRGVTLTGYVAGSVAVTHVVRPSVPPTPPSVVGKEHALGMAYAPNCGSEGCVKAYLWSWDWESSKLVLVEVFDLK